MKIIEPKTPDEFKKYYNLRYEILRKPWGQPPGSERDEGEELSIHRMIIDEKAGDALAVGRLQFNSEDEAQIRYMAVSDDFQGQGLGSLIIFNLEDTAKEKGILRIMLQARGNALRFYTNNGYEIIVSAADSYSTATLAVTVTVTDDGSEDTDSDGFFDGEETPVGSSSTNAGQTPLHVGLEAFYPFNGRSNAF